MMFAVCNYIIFVSLNKKKQKKEECNNKNKIGNLSEIN